MELYYDLSTTTCVCNTSTIRKHLHISTQRVPGRYLLALFLFYILAYHYYYLL